MAQDGDSEMGELAEQCEQTAHKLDDALNRPLDVNDNNENNEFIVDRLAFEQEVAARKAKKRQEIMRKRRNELRQAGLSASEVAKIEMKERKEKIKHKHDFEITHPYENDDLSQNDDNDEEEHEKGFLSSGAEIISDFTDAVVSGTKSVGDAITSTVNQPVKFAVESGKSVRYPEPVNARQSSELSVDHHHIPERRTAEHHSGSKKEISRKKSLEDVDKEKLERLALRRKKSAERAQEILDTIGNEFDDDDYEVLQNEMNSEIKDRNASKASATVTFSYGDQVQPSLSSGQEEIQRYPSIGGISSKAYRSEPQESEQDELAKFSYPNVDKSIFKKIDSGKSFRYGN